VFALEYEFVIRGGRSVHPVLEALISETPSSRCCRGISSDGSFQDFTGLNRAAESVVVVRADRDAAVKVEDFEVDDVRADFARTVLGPSEITGCHSFLVGQAGSVDEPLYASEVVAAQRNVV